MKKIISLFKRNYDGDWLVRDEVVDCAEWVIAGEGVATRKFDGTCCKVEDGQLWKRREVKRGQKPPPGFVPATEVDPNTGKQQGWVLVDPEDPSDKFFVEAFDDGIEDGTYELCGPKVQGNAEGFRRHVLVPHGEYKLEAPRTFDELKDWLAERDLEGIVWHHPDGRMVKIKKKDFGLKRTGRMVKL